MLPILHSEKSSVKWEFALLKKMSKADSFNFEVCGAAKNFIRNMNTFLKLFRNKSTKKMYSDQDPGTSITQVFVSLSLCPPFDLLNYAPLYWVFSLCTPEAKSVTCSFLPRFSIFANLCRSAGFFLQGSAKIVALNLEDPYRSARSLQKCADFL